MNDHAITQLCRIAMEGFARAANAARPGSPMDRARTKLGNRFSGVACDALRATLRRVPFDLELRDLITQASPGMPVGELWIATVVADTSTAVLAVADETAA